MSTEGGFPEFEFDLGRLTPADGKKEEEPERRRPAATGRRSGDTMPGIQRPAPQDLTASATPSADLPRHLVDFRHVAQELEKGSLEQSWDKNFWSFLPWVKKSGPVKVNFASGNVGPLSQAMFPFGRPAQIVFGQMKGGVGKSVHSISLAAVAALSGRAEEVSVLFWEATKSSDLDIRLAMSEATTQRELVEGWAQGVSEKEHLENSALKEPQTGLRILFSPHDSQKYLSLTEMQRVHAVAKRVCNLLVIDTDPGDPLEESPSGALLRHILLSAHAVVVPARSEYASITDAARYIRNCQEIGVPQSRIWFVLTGGLLDLRNLSPTLWKHISPTHFFKIPEAHDVVERALISFKIPGLESQELYDSYRELLRRLLAGSRAEMATPSEKTVAQVTRLRNL
jgi:MinD-like ATPase involved in chromosome partitioning or flagellar assembly